MQIKLNLCRTLLPLKVHDYPQTQEHLDIQQSHTILLHIKMVNDHEHDLKKLSSTGKKKSNNITT